MRTIPLILVLTLAIGIAAPATAPAYEWDYSCGMALLYPGAWQMGVTCLFSLMADVTTDWWGFM